MSKALAKLHKRVHLTAEEIVFWNLFEDVWRHECTAEVSHIVPDDNPVDLMTGHRCEDCDNKWEVSAYDLVVAAGSVTGPRDSMYVGFKSTDEGRQELATALSNLCAKFRQQQMPF
jgi:hypothetical protein